LITLLFVHHQVLVFDETGGVTPYWTFIEKIKLYKLFPKQKFKKQRKK